MYGCMYLCAYGCMCLCVYGCMYLCVYMYIDYYFYSFYAGSSGFERHRFEINLVAKSLGEVLSLEGSTIREILYSAEEAHMWLLDSIDTFHVTPHHEWFTDYSWSAGSVWLGNAHECRISRVGTIPLRLPNNNEIILQQERHIPDLKRSLISIGMLADHVYRKTLNESTWQISKGNMDIRHGVKYNNLYPLTMIRQEGTVIVTEILNSWL